MVSDVFFIVIKDSFTLHQIIVELTLIKSIVGEYKKPCTVLFTVEFVPFVITTVVLVLLNINRMQLRRKADRLHEIMRLFGFVDDTFILPVHSLDGRVDLLGPLEQIRIDLLGRLDTGNLTDRIRLLNFL